MTSHHFSSAGDGWEDWNDWGENQTNNNNSNNNNPNTQIFTPQVYNPAPTQNPYSLQSSVFTPETNSNNVSFNSSLVNHNNSQLFNQFAPPPTSTIQQQPLQPTYNEVQNNVVLQEEAPPPPPDNFSNTLYMMNQSMNLPDPPQDNSNVPSQIPLVQTTNQQPTIFQPTQPDPLDSFSMHQPFEMFPTPPVANFVETSAQIYTPYTTTDFIAPSSTLESTSQNPIELNLVESNKEHVDIVDNDVGGFGVSSQQNNSMENPRMMPPSQSDHHKTSADRDNYIVTGQLSQENVVPLNMGLPPPGLSRMVVGQNENNDASHIQRMVTGTENSPYPNYQREIDGEVSQSPQPMRVPSPQIVANDVNNFMNYQRQADGEVSIDSSSRPPIEHMQTGDRSSYFVTGGTESQSDGQRFVPGVESDISMQMQTLQIGGDNNDFSNRENEVEGIDVTSREENIDGANDNSETSNTISDRNEVETNAREGAIDGYDNKNDENKRSNLDTSDDDKELQELESKSRSKSNRKHNDSFDSDSHSKSREKADSDRKDRHGHASNYSDSRRRNDDSDEYYRKKEKKRSSRGKKYSDNDEYASERGEKSDRVKRNRYKEKDRDSGSGRRKEYYDEERRAYRRERERRPHGESSRDRDREKYNYYSQYPGYDSYNSYYQQQQYFENLRRTNPQAYYEWYTKYYANMMQQQTMMQQQQQDEISLRSGYSSSNEKDRISVTRFQTGGPISHPLQSMNSSVIDGAEYTSMRDYSMNQSFNQNYYDNREKLYPENQRLTPKKFQSLHSFVELSHGISIAKDTSVTIQNIQVSDKTRRIYQTYPGPLVRQTSHKKTVIEFCEEKLSLRNQHKQFEASYSLIWSFLILIIRQNGNYTEGDISELLMKNSEEFKSTLDKHSQDTGSGKQTPEQEQDGSEIGSNEVSTSQSVVSEELVIHKFREYLLYGNVGDALDFATDNNLWGHALFLASKVDKRQHANVMLKFANKLPYNDPLQTLYQIMSGRTPACVTNLDDKWGDWRPHLAMIISNSKDKPELVKKSIIQLGDHLFNRGDVFGSHFCYLIAEPCFGEFTTVESRIVLIGTSHKQNFKDFASDEAIMMTEIFEYARSLSDANFNIISLAKFKFLLATRMLDYGFQLKALLYMEEIARQIIKQPQMFDSEFTSRVYTLADRLKFYDPVLAKSYEDNYNNNEWETAENQKWLQDLLQIVNMGYVSQQSVHSSPQFSQHDQVQMNQQVSSIDEYGYDAVAQYHQQTPVHVPAAESTPNHTLYQNDPLIPTQPPPIQQQQTNYQNSENFSYEYHQPSLVPEQISQDQPDVNDQSNNYNDQQYNNYYGGYDQSQFQSQPTISLGNTMTNKFNEESSPGENSVNKEVSQPKHQSPEKAKKPSTDDANHSHNSGWFGGIFSKLSMKPKNQMILPDDKNPTIVWDEKTKKWVNKDGSGPEAEEFKPPPKMGFPQMPQQIQQQNAEMPKSAVPPAMMTPQQHPQQQQQQQMPMMNSHEFVNQQQQQQNEIPQQMQPAAPNNEPPSQNMFKMQKGRNIKKSYVNLLSNTGQTVAAKEPDMQQFFNPITAGSQQQAQTMQFYNPNDFN